MRNIFKSICDVFTTAASHSDSFRTSVAQWGCSHWVQGSTAASLQILQLSLPIPCVIYVVGIKAVVVASVAVTVETVFPRPLPLLFSLKFSPLSWTSICDSASRLFGSILLLVRFCWAECKCMHVCTYVESVQKRPVYQKSTAQTCERTYRKSSLSPTKLKTEN